MKGCAIWTSAFREFVTGGRTDPVLGLSGWYVQRRQDAVLAAMLTGLPTTPPVRSEAQSELGHLLIAAGAGMATSAHDAFGGATFSITGLLSLLAAEEAEKAAAWRLADIAAMQALLGETAPGDPGEMTLPALDARWAQLADALIAQHDRIAAAGGDESALFAFYRESAARRELSWPG